MRFKAIAVLALSTAVAATALSSPCAADDDLVKSGTLTLKGWQVSFIGSASKSTGVLTYKGKKRKFSLSGLGVGGFGVSTSEATGTVYNMKKVDDFIGTFLNLRSGVTVGEDEVVKDKVLWMKNDNGVTIELITDREGIQLNLGADGMISQWDD